MQKNDIIASIKSLDDRVFLFNSNHALIKASVDVRRGIKLRFFFFFLFCPDLRLNNYDDRPTSSGRNEASSLEEEWKLLRKTRCRSIIFGKHRPLRKEVAYSPVSTMKKQYDGKRDK